MAEEKDRQPKWYYNDELGLLIDMQGLGAVQVRPYNDGQFSVAIIYRTGSRTGIVLDSEQTAKRVVADIFNSFL